VNKRNYFVGFSRPSDLCIMLTRAVAFAAVAVSCVRAADELLNTSFFTDGFVGVCESGKDQTPIDIEWADVKPMPAELVSELNMPKVSGLKLTNSGVGLKVRTILLGTLLARIAALCNPARVTTVDVLLLLLYSCIIVCNDVSAMFLRCCNTEASCILARDATQGTRNTPFLDKHCPRPLQTPHFP
jgi:hypothetical protein